MSKLNNPNVVVTQSRRTADPLGSVDKKVLEILGNGPVTAGQVRAAHKQAFGTEAGATACVVRFDRAGRLYTASGELGSRGRLAAERAQRHSAASDEAGATFAGAIREHNESSARAPRASRAPKPGAVALLAEYERLREAHPEMGGGELAVMAEENVARALRPERAPRPPADPLRKTDPRVRAALGEATAEGPIDREGLRIIHAATFGDRPTEPGEARDTWDHRFALCVPRLRRAGLLLARQRGAAAPPESGPRERAAREPANPLRKSDPRVRELVEAAGGPIALEGLRLIHDEVFGPRPAAEGPEQDSWDANFARCVPRLRRAHLLLTRGGTVAAAPAARGKGAAAAPKRDASDLRVMREARGELSCLRKHAMAVAKVDADACPLGRSKAEGDALRASKMAALKDLDALWTSAVKSDSPTAAIQILGDAADLVSRKFPGNRYGYETKAAGVLSAALGAGSAEAAE